MPDKAVLPPEPHLMRLILFVFGPVDYLFDKFAEGEASVNLKAFFSLERLLDQGIGGMKFLFQLDNFLSNIFHFIQAPLVLGVPPPQLHGSIRWLGPRPKRKLRVAVFKIWVHKRTQERPHVVLSEVPVV